MLGHLNKKRYFDIEPQMVAHITAFQIDHEGDMEPVFDRYTDHLENKELNTKTEFEKLKEW